MPLQIITIPCLSDNYAYLLRETETGQVAVVDVPEAAPILGALERSWMAPASNPDHTPPRRSHLWVG